MGNGFVGFVNEFGGAGTPLFKSIALSGHESEYVVEEVMCRFV